MTIQRLSNWPRKKTKGQTMAEFAIAFPIFLIVVLGIFEFGRLFITYISVYAAAREGARYGAAAANLCTPNIEAEAERAGFLAGDLVVSSQYQVYDDELKLVSADCASAKAGDRVVVTASKVYESITGLIPNIPMSSQARRTIVVEAHLSWTLAPPSTSVPNAGVPTSAGGGGGGGTSTPSSPTSTPTEAAASPTVTPTTSGVCDGTITWTANTNSASNATFTNNSGEQYTLTQIIVTWQKLDPLLNEVLYVNSPYDPITDLLMSSPATVEIPDWVIGTGSSTFEFTFSLNNAKFTGVTLIMEDAYGNSCEVH